MALELIKDTIRFDHLVGEGQSQVLFNKDIIVPDIKPDIGRILSVEGRADITGKSIEQNRVTVDGDIKFEILYSVGDEPQPINSINFADNFSQYIDIPGTMPNMDANLRCSIEHIDYNRINGRKINIQCVLMIKGKVIDKIPVEVVKDASGLPDIQILRDSVYADEVIGENTAQTIVRGTIQIPSGIPSADELIKCGAFIHKKDVMLEDGKINIAGSLFVPVLFSSKEDKPDIYKLEEDFVFNHVLDMQGVEPQIDCKVDYSIEDLQVEFKEDEDGEKRLIEIEAVIGFKVKVSKRNEYMVIADIYAPSVRIEPEKMDLSIDLLYGKNTSETVIKESMQLPKDYPEMEKVYDLICKPSITDCKVLDEKAVIEGVAECDIIYLARGEERLVHSFSDEVPFKTSVSMPGCTIDMKPDAEINIESIDFSMLTRTEIEVKIELECSIKLYQKLSKEFVIKAEEIEGKVPYHKASITIYMVQPKDTLWMIAKRYYTTVEDIVKINNIENPDMIMPGMKLIIPKKVY